MAERIGKDKLGAAKKNIMGRVDFLYPKEVQTKSSINGGMTTYTVGGVIHKQETDKLSPGRLDNIKNGAWWEYGTVMEQLWTAEFNEIIDSRKLELFLISTNFFASISYKFVI